MTYFSVNLSKKLQEKGLVSESGYAHYFNAGKPVDAIVDMTMYEDASDEFKQAKLKPAFIFQDLLTKDNAVKLWGDIACYFGHYEIVSAKRNKFSVDRRTIKYREIYLPAWQYKSDHLLELYQQSGLEAIESYLEENL